MICIHRTGLATVIPSFIRVFIIHVVRDSDLGKDKRMITHVIEAFLSEELELVAQAVSDGGLTNLDCKSGR